MSEDKGKTPLQASGEGRPKPQAEGVGVPGTHGRTESESQGGAYPNPHTGKEEAGKSGGFHGGQSEAAYHGTGQLGEDDVKGLENQNSATKKG
ncbi:hypothetical protein HNO88_003014 [Novosphingobium chloroacetimidivorans]|uniref:Uncharacterized protein n=1 Tax=Novosphingobium chloroacetimidivorans TaxID=1428314 RepID=A0A7W7NXY0_9SPHN|nr:hypothetical protein [Novosphingobium chloroacetimidivorans]MBB4859685.1 hypothetical protein [Novosphingobium chloroacetimidivorans]